MAGPIHGTAHDAPLRRSLALPAIIVFITCLGLSQHLAFSLSVGEIAFFKGAYDEDSYLLFGLQGIPGIYRFLSNQSTGLIYWLTGRSADATMMAMDVIWPVLASASAYFLASQVVRSQSARLLGALLLLFGAEILSIGNNAVWTGQVPSFAWFKSLFGEAGSFLVPYFVGSYLSLFRSPEPQMSLAFFFLLLAFLTRVAFEVPSPRRPDIAAAAGLILLAPFCYVFLSVAGLSVALGSAAILFLFRRIGAGLWLLAAIAIAAAVFTLDMFGERTSGPSFIFRSHLPVITPSVIASLLLSLAWAGWCARNRVFRRDAAFTLLVLAAPVAICNQQILTGVMVRTWDWEQNTNYALLVLGVMSAARIMTGPRRSPDPSSALSRAAVSLKLVALLIVTSAVAVAHGTSYGYFLPQNLRSLAAARALASTSFEERSELLLEVGDAEILVQARAPLRYRLVLDRMDTYARPVPPMNTNGDLPQSPHTQRLFEYWWRTGIDPAAAKKLLESEARDGVGWALEYLFAHRDFWHYATDGRATRSSAIAAHIPTVVAQYRAFLDGVGDPAVSGKSVVRLRQAREGPPRSGQGLVDQRIGTGQAGEIRVDVYRQAYQGTPDLRLGR